MARLRVAFVLSAATNGGTESQAALLARGLAEHGVHVDVFLLDGRLATQDFASAPVHVLSPSGSARFVRALAPALAAYRLGRSLRHGNYDVVHAMMARAHVLAPLLASGGRARPFVVAWRRNMGAHSGNRAFDAVERFAAWRTDVIVGNSPAVVEYWQGRRHRPRSGYRMVPNGLESWRFDRVEAAQLSLARHHLVSVGNLRPVKGHLDLIEAAAQVRAGGEDVGVLIVGEGPLHKELVARAAIQAVPLEIVGGVRDTRPYLQAARVYVQPSHQEGSSNAIGEAMAQGCSVVTTSTGDAVELVGELGRVVPAKRPDLLAEALRVVLGEGAAVRDAAVVERAKRLRGVGVVVESHVKIYRDGVNDVRHRRGD